MPIRLRLALVCAALVSVLVVGLGAVVYLRLEGDLIGAVDDELLTRAGVIAEEGPKPDLDVNQTDVGDVFAQRVARDGRVVGATEGFDAVELIPPTELAALQTPVARYASVQTGDEVVPTRLLALPASDGTVVVTGVAIDDQQAALSTLATQFALALPIAIVLAGGVGWLVAGAAVRPVERMRREAEAISGSEPDRRLPVPATRDELAALGASLNRMLDRIEATVERERRFVDDASHELRTPLANLKSELDLALMRSRSEQDLISALRSAGDETDRLVRLAEDLLVLARADGGRLPIRREPIDLAQVAHDTIESFAGRAVSLGVTIDLVGAPRIEAMADPERIRQALGDLIDNALRFSSRGGRVTVGLSGDGDGVTITVADSGPGFPAGFLASAFEPFSRADPARGRADGGAGLGLAIVRAVAQAHGGDVQARNDPAGGAIVALRLPV
jgi:two-component system OmpR family sensor kinase